jgi:aconitate hydratase
MSVFDASTKYQADGAPLIVVAGKEYGSGSSRDWAAKGPKLLGVHAVIAQSYERIHRSNLVGMGILPLQFLSEEDPEALGLNGEEMYEISGLREMLDSKFASGRHVRVSAQRGDGTVVQFETTVRIDTPQEILYYQHGGILQFVLRQLLAGWEKPKVVSRGMSTVADVSTGSSIT